METGSSISRKRQHANSDHTTTSTTANVDDNGGDIDSTTNGGALDSTINGATSKSKKHKSQKNAADSTLQRQTYTLWDMNLKQCSEGQTSYDPETTSLIFAEFEILINLDSYDDDFKNKISWYAPLDWSWPFHPFDLEDPLLVWFLEERGSQREELLNLLQETFYKYRPWEKWTGPWPGNWNDSNRIENLRKIWIGADEFMLRQNGSIGNVPCLDLGELPDGVPQTVRTLFEKFRDMFNQHAHDITKVAYLDWMRRFKSPALMFAWYCEFQPWYFESMSYLLTLGDVDEEHQTPQFLENFFQRACDYYPRLTTEEGESGMVGK